MLGAAWVSMLAVMSRMPGRLRPGGGRGQQGRALLKHYRGAPVATNDVPMDRWSPQEVSAHMAYMSDFAHRLEGTGEFVDVESTERAIELAGDFSVEPGAGGRPIREWQEARPFLDDRPNAGE